MANDIRCLSIEDEAKLLAPIDEYIGKIQEQIDALRVDLGGRRIIKKKNLFFFFFVIHYIIQE